MHLLLLYPKYVIKRLRYNLGYYNSPPPPLKRIPSSKFIPELKSYGYCALIVASRSQVAFSLPWYCQSTFTNCTCLFRNYFTSRGRIAFGSSSYGKYVCTSTYCTSSMCDPLERYFRSIDTWNTSCYLANFGGSANRYATGLILSKTSYEPMNLGLSFPFFPNLSIFLHGDTFKNTLSPTSYSLCFLFKSAYDFCRSLTTFNLCRIT